MHDATCPGNRSDGEAPVSVDLLKVYIREISRYPVLSRDEEFTVTRLVWEQNDPEAAQKIILSNLRLVVKIALDYYNIYISILDLIQEGNMGLLRAVKKYSPYKGSKFSSYAARWIKAYIKAYIMNSKSMVKVATTQAKRKIYYNLDKERHRLESLDIYPSLDLVAANLGVKEWIVEEMSQRLSVNDLSLDAPLHEGSEETVLDSIESEENVEEIVTRHEEFDTISRKFCEFRNSLGERDALIFDRRILAEEAESLKRLGLRFNISKERVRQLEQGIMNLLRTRLEEDRAELGR